jgi:hypothetical protein
LASGDFVLTIIVPAFHTYPEHGTIIGRLVMGYSEFELMLAFCTSLTLDVEQDDILRAFFRIKSESNKFALADALMHTPLKRLGLEPLFAELKPAYKHCLKIRNQYAHCQWSDTASGLFFVDLDETAVKFEGFEHRHYHIDVPLLSLQEEFFAATRMFLLYFEHEIKLKMNRAKQNIRAKPSMPPLPGLHNPEDQHPYP